MCLAVPVKILEISGKTGKAEIGGVRREINLTFIEDLNIGDYVLLHAGFAIQVIDEKEALEAIEIWEQMEKLV